MASLGFDMKKFDINNKPHFVLSLFWVDHLKVTIRIKKFSSFLEEWVGGRVGSLIKCFIVKKLFNYFQQKCRLNRYYFFPFHHFAALCGTFFRACFDSAKHDKIFENAYRNAKNACVNGKWQLGFTFYTLPVKFVFKLFVSLMSYPTSLHVFSST